MFRDKRITVRVPTHGSRESPGDFWIHRLWSTTSTLLFLSFHSPIASHVFFAAWMCSCVALWGKKNSWSGLNECLYITFYCFLTVKNVPQLLYMIINLYVYILLLKFVPAHRSYVGLPLPRGHSSPFKWKSILPGFYFRRRQYVFAFCYTERWALWVKQKWCKGDICSQLLKDLM